MPATILRRAAFALRRCCATMAPPREPLLVVLGSTGTGKSELAIELARRFHGEVINADAMQLYDGLPIITNKVTAEEQRGIPHHLLGRVSLDDAPWDVDEYKSEATRVIREIRGRGKLPILVGGTQYYVDPLLFKDVILDDVQTGNPSSPESCSAAAAARFPILDGPTDAMLDELKRVDPVMAERWHPHDRRKIRRSLEIFLHTGRPASELYAEQAARKEAAAAAAARHASSDGAQEREEAEPWQNLLFWVHTEREALCKRLDARVDKMLEAGLLGEIRTLLDFKRHKAAAGHVVDTTKGIWQSIGYKQFEPLLVATDDGHLPASELEALRLAALEDMKTATRRYANYQTKWIRLKQIPRLKEQGPRALGNLYLFDSTDASRFASDVVAPAADVAARFLAGQARPLPTETSDVAREVLTRAGEPPPRETPCQRTCEACGTVCVTEEGWRRHVRSAGHRRVLKKKQKLALVAVDNETR